MRRLSFAALGLILLGTSGCARTVYRNVEPSVTLAPRAPSRHLRGESGWRHFFLFGWVPSEQIVDAAAECGGAQYVSEIRTEQSFVQGVLYVLTNVYVTVYAPYTGEVVCVGDRR
jgi:hypothetical protein